MELEHISGITPEENANFSDNEHNGLDLPPEYEGCEFASSCLNCPFSRCIYDEQGGRQHHAKSLRNNDMVRLRREGRGVRELALIFGVSQRTVQRALKGSAEKEMQDSSCRGSGGVPQEKRVKEGRSLSHATNSLPPIRGRGIRG